MEGRNIHGKGNTRKRDYTEKGEGTYMERRHMRSGDTHGGKDILGGEDIHSKRTTRNKKYTEKGEGTHMERGHIRGGGHTWGGRHRIRRLHGKKRGDTHKEGTHVE